MLGRSENGPSDAFGVFGPFSSNPFVTFYWRHKQKHRGDPTHSVSQLQGQAREVLRAREKGQGREKSEGERERRREGGRTTRRGEREEEEGRTYGREKRRG